MNIVIEFYRWMLENDTQEDYEKMFKQFRR